MVNSDTYLRSRFSELFPYGLREHEGSDEIDFEVDEESKIDDTSL